MPVVSKKNTINTFRRVNICLFLLGHHGKAPKLLVYIFLKEYFYSLRQFFSLVLMSVRIEEMFVFQVHVDILDAAI